MRHLFPAAACFTLGTTIATTAFLAMALLDPHVPVTATLLWAWYVSSISFTLSTLIANYQAATR